MKTVTQFFSLMAIVILIGIASEANAQGRGQHHDHKDRHHQKHDRDDHRKHGWKDDCHEHKHGHHHSYEQHRPHKHVVHHHHRHVPVVVRYERPRYIYYRDYDVYYDFHRDVYITWSGRNWTISASLPVVLRRVDRGRAVRMEVDYVQDDLPAYLQTHRPSYGRIYASF